MCRVCRDPFLAQPRPFAPESRISYLESCAYGTRGFICEGFSRKNSCDRQQRVWYRLLGGEEKRSSPSSAGNLTVRLLVGSRKTLRIKGSGRQRDEENCHVIHQGRHRLRHGVPLSAHSSKPESLSLSKTAKANRM